MAIIKVSEASGAVLCYMVCMVEMPHLVWGQTIGLHAHGHQIIVPELPEPRCYSPFMGWAQGGPIIEREEIAVATHDEDGWQAYYDKKGTNDDVHTGPTPLIAAMRCYCMSKLGDTVDIPEELL